MLVVLSVLNVLFFIAVARFYKYKKVRRRWRPGPVQRGADPCLLQHAHPAAYLVVAAAGACQQSTPSACSPLCCSCGCPVLDDHLLSLHERLALACKRDLLLCAD